MTVAWFTLNVKSKLTSTTVDFCLVFYVLSSIKNISMPRRTAIVISIVSALPIPWILLYVTGCQSVRRRICIKLFPFKRVSCMPVWLLAFEHYMPSYIKYSLDFSLLSYTRFIHLRWISWIPLAAL